MNCGSEDYSMAKIQTLDEIMREEEERLLAEDNTPQRPFRAAMIPRRRRGRGRGRGINRF